MRASRPSLPVAIGIVALLAIAFFALPWPTKPFCVAPTAIPILHCQP